MVGGRTADRGRITDRQLCVPQVEDPAHDISSGKHRYKTRLGAQECRYSASQRRGDKGGGCHPDDAFWGMAHPQVFCELGPFLSVSTYRNFIQYLSLQDD